MQEGFSVAVMQLAPLFDAVITAHYWRLFESHLMQYVIAYDYLFPASKPDCVKNIMCECQRRKCPGRTLAASTYVRRVMNGA